VILSSFFGVPQNLMPVAPQPEGMSYSPSPHTPSSTSLKDNACLPGEPCHAITFSGDALGSQASTAANVTSATEHARRTCMHGYFHHPPLLLSAHAYNAPLAPADFSRVPGSLCAHAYATHTKENTMNTLGAAGCSFSTSMGGAAYAG
jgi:hypothetical protein